MVKRISVNEDLVPAMNFFGEEDEPSVAVKGTLERLVCSLYKAEAEIDIK